MRLVVVLVCVALAGCEGRDAEEPGGGVPRTADAAEEKLMAIRAAMDGEDYEGAEAMLTALIMVDPADFDAVSGRAAVRVLRGDRGGAQEDFERAVGIDPERGKDLRFFIADRAMWRARGFDMEERYEEALRIYDVLLALFPKAGMVYHDRGGLRTSMGDYAGAIEDLTKAIEFDEGNNAAGDSHVLRARARRAAGDEAGAAADDAKAEEIYQSFGK